MRFNALPIADIGFNRCWVYYPIYFLIYNQSDVQKENLVPDQDEVCTRGAT